MVREGMRGDDQQQNHIFSYLSPEERVRKDPARCGDCGMAICHSHSGRCESCGGDFLPELLVVSSDGV
jgi:hypothetical protein